MPRHAPHAFCALLALAACAPPAVPSPDGSAPPPDAPASDAAPPGDTAGDGATELPVPPLEFGPCDRADVPPGYTLPADLACAQLAVPVDRADPSRGQVTLRVAIHRATGTDVRGAVFQLAGGPGGSSVAQAGIIPRALPGLREHFDLVYVDQRGTGGSDYLGCGPPYPASREEWTACAQQYSDRHLEAYTTAAAADDLDEVRRALGRDAIYLRAGSYGTRLGVEYARRHGAHVAAMVLDGAAPPDVDFFAYATEKLDRAVAMLVAECSADAACTAVSPALQADLDALVAQLRASPRAIRVGGVAQREDAGTFADTLEGALETASLRYRVPRAVHARVGGDASGWDAIMGEVFGATVEPVASRSEPWVRAARRWAGAASPRRRRRIALRAQDYYVAPGVYFAVSCTESWPLLPSLDGLRALAAAQRYGTRGQMVALAEACTDAALAAVPRDQLAPVTSDVPALVLSGEVDINTPEAWGEHMAATLSRARHVVVPHATHGTMLVPCVGGVIVQYFNAGGDMARVDASCIAQLGHPAW